MPALENIVNLGPNRLAGSHWGLLVDVKSLKLNWPVEVCCVEHWTLETANMETGTHTLTHYDNGILENAQWTQWTLEHRLYHWDTKTLGHYRTI